MGPEELRDYEEGMLKEIGAWEGALSKSDETVSAALSACDLDRRLM
jgi:hypothetical protein